MQLEIWVSVVKKVIRIDVSERLQLFVRSVETLRGIFLTVTLEG